MIATLAFLLISAAPASAQAAPMGSTPASTSELDGPKDAIESLARAYRAKSIDQYAALLAADYRFHWVNPRQPAEYVAGFDREFEISSARAMFTGGVAHAGQAPMPAADSITVRVGELTESADAEHPDSSEYYRVISANPFHLHMYIKSTKGFDVTHGLEIFYLVRGDAAVLAPDQSASAKSWYIRRWLDDTGGLSSTLAQTQGTCNQHPADNSATEVSMSAAVSGASTSATSGRQPPLALAIHPLGNPACPALEISCDLPGNENARIEVYDVMGRLRARKDVAAPEPGTHVIAVGEGAELHPGAYWVRLTQGTRVPSARMVVVAR